MFGLSHWELMMVAVIAVLLFGNRLPDVARSVGKSFGEFKKGLSDMQSEVRSTEAALNSYDQADDSYEDYEEATAPKFEPPASEPQAEEKANS